MGNVAKLLAVATVKQNNKIDSYINLVMQDPSLWPLEI